jgi:23S rRNA (uracil1939-C5)-methyltransferase
LCAETVNQAIESCREQLRNDHAFFGSAREIDIQSSVHSGTAIISTPGRFGNRVSYVCAPPDFACRPSATPLRDTVGGMLFIRSPGSFYQGNSAQNEHMIACIIGVFDCRRHRRVLDVYCGCGNFSLFLARSGIDVTGIDTLPRAVQEARANAHFNKLTNCTFHADRAENISRLCSGGNVDGVLLNPPRTGCSARVLDSVCSLHPHTIAYVSCNPATLARDTAILATRGYTLKTVQPFDMFPHTYHIESIAVLHRH